MALVDLFPYCTDDDCTRRGLHKHILPHQLGIINSPARFLYVQGGFGSAKTLAAVVKCHATMMAVPGIRGLIGRETYPKLHDTTQRIFMEVLERSGIDGVDFRETRDKWSQHLIYPNGSEVFFRPTKDLGRFLGPEYGFFLIDEAQEEPEKTFTDLVGRLRLPLARKHLFGMLLSNPPQETHWLHKHFGDHPGVTEKTAVIDGKSITTKYHFMKVSTRLNPHVGKAYIADLITTHGEEEARRIVDGEYGFVSKGTPVYRPPYNQLLHVGEPRVNPNLGLIRGWDFGRRHPAVTWHQVYTCGKGHGHWVILAELANLLEIESSELAKRVLEYSAQRFPQMSQHMYLDCGDRSGVNKTDRGPGPITTLAQPPYNLRIRYLTCDIQSGIDFISDLLRRGLCTCNYPTVIVHRDCKAVRDGFAGGYAYPQTKPERAPKDKPNKDGYYDDVMDSVRYAAENYVRQAMDNTEWLSEILMEKNEALVGANEWLLGW